MNPEQPSEQPSEQLTGQTLVLQQDGGLRAELLTRGGYLASLRVPMPGGEVREVVLGYADAQGYAHDNAHLGALIGRCANRIRGGRFSLDGREIQLPQNAPGAHLHGGAEGYHRRLWHAEPRAHAADPIALGLHDADGSMGYPGSVAVEAHISLPTPMTLRLDLQARVSAPTPVNLTWHPYFNLAGDAAGRLGEHELQVQADFWLPMAEDCCPTGEITRAARTPFDLRDSVMLQDVLAADHPQLALAGGLDHCLLPQGNGLRPVAQLTSPTADLTMQLWCTSPGLQVYTANSLPAGTPTLRYRNGAAYGRHSAICLEPQGLPNAVNTPLFPSVIVTPDDLWQARMEYRFVVG